MGTHRSWIAWLVVLPLVLAGCAQDDSVGSQAGTDANPAPADGPMAHGSASGTRLLFASTAPRNASVEFDGSLGMGGETSRAIDLAGTFDVHVPTQVVVDVEYDDPTFQSGFTVQLQGGSGYVYRSSTIYSSQGLAGARSVEVVRAYIPTEPALSVLLSVGPTSPEVPYRGSARIETFPDTVPATVPISLPHPGGDLTLVSQATCCAEGGHARIYGPGGALVAQGMYGPDGRLTFHVPDASPGRYGFVSAAPDADFSLTISGHEHPAGFLEPLNRSLVQGEPQEVAPDGTVSWTFALDHAPLTVIIQPSQANPAPGAARQQSGTLVTPSGEAIELSGFEFVVTQQNGYSAFNGGTLGAPLLDHRLIAGTYRIEYRHEAGANFAVTEWVTLLDLA